MKIKADLHHWLKVRSVTAGIPMYELLEIMLATGRGRPWREARYRGKTIQS